MLGAVEKSWSSFYSHRSAGLYIYKIELAKLLGKIILQKFDGGWLTVFRASTFLHENINYQYQ